MAVLSCYFIKKLQLASPFRGEVARRRRVGGGQVIILGIFKKKDRSKWIGPLTPSVTACAVPAPP